MDKNATRTTIILPNGALASMTPEQLKRYLAKGGMRAEVEKNDWDVKKLLGERIDEPKEG